MESRSRAWIGAPLRRSEDPRFLRGQATYVADLDHHTALEVVFIRSPHASARIVEIDASEALRAGAVAVLDGQAVAERARPIVMPSRYASFKPSEQPALAQGVVRYVGEPVAAIAADGTRAQVEDLADLVRVKYEALPPVVDLERAIAPGSPQVHPRVDRNIYVERTFSAGEAARVIASARHRVRRRFRTQRHAAVPLEARGCLARFDPGTGELTLWTSTQIPHLVRTELARILRFPEQRLRVIAPDVGGGFGMKSHLWPEEVAICLLALRTGRPVRWIQDRREDLVANTHSRDHLYLIEAGVDETGRILALQAELLVDVGAYSVWPWTAAMEPMMAGGILPGPYRIEHYECTVRAVATNKTPVGPYRGVARPSAAFAMERLIDEIAVETGIDPVELRRRNLIRSEDFPYTSPTRLVHESGAYEVGFERAVEAVRSGKDGDPLRPSERVGYGFACGVELTALGTATSPGPGIRLAPGIDSATVRIDPTGAVSVFAGIASHGQGLETTLAQIAADELGVSPSQVRVVHGDSDRCPYGMGTWGSRSAVIAGGAVRLAAGELREKMRAIAAHLLEVDVGDVVLEQGWFSVTGTPDRGIPVDEVARVAHLEARRLPKEIEAGLESTRFYDPVRGTFSSSTHAVKVAVDVETGELRILRYVVVEDCGTMLNPLIVEGQMMGGVAQGLGAALFEHAAYDESGQPLAGTFMDYLLPGFTEMPRLELHHTVTPATTTLGGVRGTGETGTIPVPAALANAVADALRPLGVAIDRLPLDPASVYGAIQAAVRREPAMEGRD